MAGQLEVGSVKVVSPTGLQALNLSVSDAGVVSTDKSFAFTGTPTAPTATAGTNTTQIATTSFAKTVSEANAIGVGQTWQNVGASRVS